MTTRRKFTFPLATLTRSAGLLESALADPAYKPAMDERLGDDFATTFSTRITALGTKSDAQASLTGDIAGLTAEQLVHFQEMERLSAGARRTAKLAFPGQATILREEFQVGVDDSKSLAAELQRAGKTHAATLKYAAQLKIKGWIPADSTQLGNAIASLGGKDQEQEESLDERLGLTNEKTIEANALYADCLTIQNAARLQYPSGTDANGNARNLTERARFLLDEFPPRDHSHPDDTPTPPPTDTPPAP